MNYSLRRVRDGAGDCGPMSQCFDPATATIIGERPAVGYSMCVGSYVARTFQYQDYWTTTPVTEIIEQSDDRVRFKTRNSEYIWERLP